MSGKSKAELMAATRARRKAAGQKRAEVWVHPEDEPRLRKYVARLNQARRL